MANLNTFPKLQPQIAQLECLFKAPLVKDSAVNTFNELLLFNPDYNYNHKIVWVRDQTANYYLAEGDGTINSNWRRIATRAVINKYNSQESYQLGEAVYLSGKIYTATQTVPKFYTPLSYPEYWLTISGETNTYRYLFQNVSSVIIYTEVRNPKFEIMLGDFVLDINGEQVISEVTGLAVLKNTEIVDVLVHERPDLKDGTGFAYEIKFFVDETLTNQISGCINIK